MKEQIRLPFDAVMLVYEKMKEQGKSDEIWNTEIWDVLQKVKEVLSLSTRESYHIFRAAAWLKNVLSDKYFQDSDIQERISKMVFQYTETEEGREVNKVLSELFQN
ncbi:hypothetical protein KAT95_02345 [Candidatus Parcubacteria bacterium]|nr:hypothetical protein [Candidatus Parcubacteria bacterium]